MIGIDLFAGAGGMTLGARSQGINVRIAVERDPFAVATYRRNNAEVDVFCGDIRRFTKFPACRRGEAKEARHAKAFRLRISEPDLRRIQQIGYSESSYG